MNNDIKNFLDINLEIHELYENTIHEDDIELELLDEAVKAKTSGKLTKKWVMRDGVKKQINTCPEGFIFDKKLQNCRRVTSTEKKAFKSAAKSRKKTMKAKGASAYKQMAKKRGKTMKKGKSKGAYNY